MRSEAEELEMQKERYFQDLHQALTGTGSSVTYNFTLTPQPTATSSTTTTTLAYEKVQKDISVRNAPPTSVRCNLCATAA